MLPKVKKAIFENPYYVKYKAFLIPVGSILICIILLTLVIIPQFLNSVNTGKTIKETNSRADAINNKISTLEKINPSDYQTNIDTALVALPSDKDIPGAINQALYLVATSRLQLNNISFSNSAGTTTIKLDNYQIRLEVTGDPSGIKDFASKLREAPRLMKLNSIEITSLGDPTKVQAAINLSVFYQGLANKLGDAEQPVSLISDNELQTLSTIRNNAALIPSSIGTNRVETTGKSDPFN